MKVITGNYKNKRIISSLKKSQHHIRPTKSRVKKAVFDIIANHFIKENMRISDLIFLDLCCGTGSIGIEAISRGFKKIYFIDQSYESLNILKYNLNNLGLNILNFSILRANIDYIPIKLDSHFDVIYLDPPYEYKIQTKLLKHIYDLIKQNSILIIESSKKVGACHLYKYVYFKKYGNTTISVFQK